jgi:predicted amino acid dehydrogenase
LAAGLIARTVINQAAKFAKHRLGAKVMGLGAILPALTRYGQTIHVDGLTTTTGHGGTVALIGETVSKAIEGVGLPSNRIGIIGSAGSIGRSSLALLLEQYPDASFDVHDVKTMERVMAALSPADKARVNVAKSIEDVFRSSKVVVSAITSTINLGKDHPSASLDGTVIIDDSQPGAFMRDEVESLGGRVVWVVGNDDSREGTATRVGGYQFGNDTGLHRSTNVWGCEAEAYSVATTGRLDLALRSAVTPEKARAIGELLKNCGIGVADYQSFGKPVDLL